MKLYSYFRSSASYRVRIALQLKGLDYTYEPIHLVRGEHRGDAFAEVSADGLVPVLQLDDGSCLSQSMAIVEYLDEAFPAVPLLPGDALGRARVRALAQTIACEVHPVNNLRILQYLTGTLGVDDEARTAWIRHWMRTGLEAFESQLARNDTPGDFCWGDTPGLADCCLVPQIFNARRFGCDLAGLPRTLAACEAAMALPAFQAAQPSASPDAEG